MAKKFKINDCVQVIATGEIGTLRGRDIVPIEGSKKVNIQYVVKLGDGFDKWRVFTKKELKSVVKEETERNVYTKVYDVVDGYKITMYAKVKPTTYPKFNDFEYLGEGKGRVLNVGYAIYSPNDEYSEKLGMRIARKRSKVSPFCKMESNFSGEFNAETVNAILDVKAEYIKNNFDKFINKA